MNDPNCRARDRAGHLCTDRDGELWDRPGAGPRPGSMCFWEAIHRAHDGDPDRRPDFGSARARLAALFDADLERRIDAGELDEPAGWPEPRSWDEAADLHEEFA